MKFQLDKNQPKIIRELKSLGYSVQSLASIGSGCPDLLVGFNGNNYLFEIKNPERRGAKRFPNELEQEYIGNWKGSIHLAYTSQDIIDIIPKSCV